MSCLSKIEYWFICVVFSDVVPHCGSEQDGGPAMKHRLFLYVYWFDRSYIITAFVGH